MNETQIEALAVQIDEFLYNWDWYSYQDALTGTREDNVESTKADLLNGNTTHIKACLTDIAEEAEDPDDIKEVNDILEKLAKVA